MYNLLANPSAFHFNVGKSPQPKTESLMVIFMYWSQIKRGENTLPFSCLPPLPTSYVAF